jgi:hypothetical protein
MTNSLSTTMVASRDESCLPETTISSMDCLSSPTGAVSVSATPAIGMDSSAPSSATAAV